MYQLIQIKYILNFKFLSMSIEEKVNFAVEKFLNEEGTLTEIMSLVNLHSTKPISNRLEELGYHMYNGAKAS